MKNEGGSGFDAEKFMKLLRMFDSPYAEEAATAFRLALAELKKDQLKFIDQIGDTAEADRLRAECTRIRSELKSAFGRCSRKEAEAEELKGIIDRLHERIKLMEGEAANNVTAENVPAEEACSPQPPIQDMGELFPSEADQPVDIVPSMTIGTSIYWIGLGLIVGLYTVLSCNRGHLITDAEWVALAKHWILWLSLLGVAGFGLYKLGSHNQFSSTWLGELCTMHLSSPRVMLRTFYGVCCAWTLAYAEEAIHASPEAQHDSLVASVLSLLVVGVAFTATVQHLSRKYGWEGLALKTALIVDSIFAFVLATFHRNPWNVHAWATFHVAEPIWLPLATYLVFVTLLLSERATAWLLEERSRQLWVAVPASFVIVISLAVGLDLSSGAQAREPQKTVTPLPSHKTKRLHRRAALHAEFAPQRLAGTGDAEPSIRPAASFIAFDPSVAPQTTSVSHPLDTDTQLTDAFWKINLKRLLGLLIVFAIIEEWWKRRRLKKARKTAFASLDTTVEGSASLASQKIAKKRGWL